GGLGGRRDPRKRACSRGTPQVPWGVSERGGIGGSSRPPQVSLFPRGAPGSLGRLRARGDWGVVETPEGERVPEGRPRLPGTTPSAGGLGGGRDPGRERGS